MERFISSVDAVKSVKELRGSIVPVVTPFRKDGSLDKGSLKELIQWLIQEGSHGVCVCGSTGEATSLTLSEKKSIYRTAIAYASSEVSFFAGVVSSVLDETLELCKYAEDLGYDALLVVVPYYTRPNQNGLFDYFSQICSFVDTSVIAYNIPARTGCNMEPETMKKLKNRFSNFVGVKEANRDFEQMNKDIMECGEDFMVYSGIESLCFPLLAVGGAGYFSATANVLPSKLSRLYELTKEGRWEEAKKLHYSLLPLNIALFWESNPVPVKAALALMGKIQEVLRPPLKPLNVDKREALARVLESYGVTVQV